MQRNQFIMPSIKENLVTVEWMGSILAGDFWCLHSDQVTALKVCADPPTKGMLANMVFDEMMKCAIEDADLRTAF